MRKRHQLQCEGMHIHIETYALHDINVRHRVEIFINSAFL